MPVLLNIEDARFVDSHNRQVTLRGVNLAADVKFPARPNLPSHLPDKFFDGDDVSFVGRPFPEEDADSHFARLRSWGFNTLRYLYVWEAIEAKGPGKYDDEYISFTIRILRRAKEHGFIVFMDPHQDTWSRLSGGSGAPMWTLYAAGLSPASFSATQAAMVQNTYPNPSTYPAMIWSTNYTRLVCLTMFTLFFAGKDFAPLAIIDGMNIQDYLQKHFNAACARLAQAVHDAGDLEDVCVIGWESMNEPAHGLCGYQRLDVIPKDQALQKGTSPTAWQAMLLGSGRACEVETWDVGGTGPYKTGTVLVDPKGISAWLPSDYDDSRYGWKRDPGWKLGTCIWALHGVWDPESDNLLLNDYFSKSPKTGELLDVDAFVNTYFMQQFRTWKEVIRAIHKDSIILCQAPVLVIPPKIINTPDADDRIVYAPHFYDGITLMSKKWNRIWNVDVLGILRGRYLFPALAIKIGERAIRACFRSQLLSMKKESAENMGPNVPVVMTEIGIPFDMDGKAAYKTGDYTDQIRAYDANMYALEGEGCWDYTLWTYTAVNSHVWGDHWNGEDLSLYSIDDNTPEPPSSSAALATKQPEPTPPLSAASSTTAVPSLTPTTSSSALIQKGTPSSSPPSTPAGTVNAAGSRAAEAFIRPCALYTHTRLITHSFDLKSCHYTLTLSSPSPTPEDAPTEIFVPLYHFPFDAEGEVEVDVSTGRWSYEHESQVLRWWHGAGDKLEIKIKGPGGRWAGSLADSDSYADVMVNGFGVGGNCTVA